jgi:hypothetical protein
MDEKEIQMFSSENSDIKCALAERAIRTLKSRLWRLYEARNSWVYLDKLNDIVDSINDSTNRSHGLRPSRVSDKNSLAVFGKLYGDIVTPQLQRDPKFQVGDAVRVAYEKPTFSKGYTPNFSKELFQVFSVVNLKPQPMYRLIDAEGALIKGKFYEPELVHVSAK